jgi:predicted nucleic acid-binding protein
LDRAKGGEVVIFTSTLTIAEVLWMKNAPRVTLDKSAAVRKFFRHSYIRTRNVTRQIAETAQDLVWHQSIAPKDAIHVATALEANIPIFETFDDGLLKRSGKIGTSSLVIRKPIPPVQPRLGRGV